MEPIVPRSLILDRARQAVQSGQPIRRFAAWPVGTVAGHEFELEVARQQALRAASGRDRLPPIWPELATTEGA